MYLQKSLCIAILPVYGKRGVDERDLYPSRRQITYRGRSAPRTHASRPISAQLSIRANDAKRARNCSSSQPVGQTRRNLQLVRLGVANRSFAVFLLALTSLVGYNISLRMYVWSHYLSCNVTLVFLPQILATSSRRSPWDWVRETCTP